MTGPLIVAIDGPAGAGKSTVSRRLAARLGFAMVDTGAVRSVIPQSVAQQLGIPTSSLRKVAYADGRTEEVPLAGPIRFVIEDRDTFDDAYVLGDEVLIGQTVLEKMDWLVDCTRQRLVPAHPDGPVNKLK